MPPLVPATVNAGVLVAVATEISPPVNPTLVTPELASVPPEKVNPVPTVTGVQVFAPLR
jgi:hypothetical protein